MRTKSTANFRMVAMARTMALAGFVNKIITIETSLTYKQVKSIRDTLVKEGHEIKRKSRTVRGGGTLIKNHVSKIQASILMASYYNFGGREVFRSINIDALIKAFTMYNGIIEEMQERINANWFPFDISDAWSLALELRDANAMLEFCDTCKCAYFTSVNQDSLIECPFCLDISPQALRGIQFQGKLGLALRPVPTPGDLNGQPKKFG